jgi:hypothetical protein
VAAKIEIEAAWLCGLRPGTRAPRLLPALPIISTCAGKTALAAETAHREVLRCRRKGEQFGQTLGRIVPNVI